MRFVGTLLLFVGYTLTYASIANHGKFAANPWMGLFFDAYTSQPTTRTGNSGSAPAKSSSSGSNSSKSTGMKPIRPRTYRGHAINTGP